MQMAQSQQQLNWKFKQQPGDGSALPPNFRRKRRHSEPQLSATKAYKNFVTHWKLDAKKSTSPTPNKDKEPTTTHINNERDSSNGWKPSGSDQFKTLFHPYKKDGQSSPTPTRTSPRWDRRTSLPQIHSFPVTAEEKEREREREDRLETIPELSFPVERRSEYRFPPLQFEYSPSSHPEDANHYHGADLAPFGVHRVDSGEERKLPSLAALLQEVQDVSLSDEEDTMAEEKVSEPINISIANTKRRMSVDSLLH